MSFFFGGKTKKAAKKEEEDDEEEEVVDTKDSKKEKEDDDGRPLPFYPLFAPARRLSGDVQVRRRLRPSMRSTPSNSCA